MRTVVSSIKNIKDRLLVISTNHYKVKDAFKRNKIKTSQYSSDSREIISKIESITGPARIPMQSCLTGVLIQGK